MNKKEQIISEKKLYCKFHVPGMSYVNRVKKNVIAISAANSYEHEKRKFDICFMLAIKGHNFLTEAEEIIDKQRYRRDIVDLTEPYLFEVPRIEIETDPNRAKRFLEDPQKDSIIVVKLWEKEGESLKQKPL